MKCEIEENYFFHYCQGEHTVLSTQCIIIAVAQRTSSTYLWDCQFDEVPFSFHVKQSNTRTCSYDSWCVASRSLHSMTCALFCTKTSREPFYLISFTWLIWAATFHIQMNLKLTLTTSSSLQKPMPEFSFHFASCVSYHFIMSRLVS